MAEQQFHDSDSDDSKESQCEDGGGPPICWDTYPTTVKQKGIDSSIVLETRKSNPGCLSLVADEIQNDSGNSEIVLGVADVSCRSFDNSFDLLVPENGVSRTVHDHRLPATSTGKEKNFAKLDVDFSTAGMTASSQQIDYTETTMEFEDTELVEWSSRTKTSDQELPSSVQNKEHLDVFLNKENDENAACRITVTAADDLSEANLKPVSLASVSSGDCVCFEPVEPEVFNDQNSFDSEGNCSTVSHPMSKAADSYLDNTGLELNVKIKIKNSDKDSVRDIKSDAMKSASAESQAELNQSASIPAMTASCSDGKPRKTGHLAIDGLRKPNANSRKSNRSKRKHSNSMVCIKHVESRKHSKGDIEILALETVAKSALVDLKRQKENFNDSAAKARNADNRDACGQKPSHSKTVKVSASHSGDTKVHRSTSYRIATTSHKRAHGVEEVTAAEAPNVSATAEFESNPSATSPSSAVKSRLQETSAKLEPVSDVTCFGSPASRDSAEMCHSDEGARRSKPEHSHRSDRSRRLSLAKDLLPISPTAASTVPSWCDLSALINVDSATTPTKSSGIRRLKELFLDKSSPKDGSGVDPQYFVFDDQHASSSAHQPISEGQLNCKNTMMDGKRSTERTWKCVYAILRGHNLNLYPDKATQNVLVYDQPISVRASLVDIAYDYVKRKNVFRLTTFNISEFLLEAPDQETMLNWIRSIQKCGYSSSDKEFSASRELLRQKRGTSRHTSRSDTHHSTHRKHSDTQRSPRLASQIPEPTGLAHPRKKSRDLSKSPQRDNAATDEDVPKSPSRKAAAAILRNAENSEHKSKDRTWKSKMVNRLKRLSSQSPATQNIEQTSAFGVELNKCIPSADNEFVPLIVDACITIVESKGLTNKGIYRVPGNSAAIAQLQAELNKDPTSINFESEKWQDVNAVISLLKLFFRELPDPLATKELYPSMIEANRVDDSTKRMLKIKRLLHHLPKHNFETFHFLARHLNKVALSGDVNMMDARNLAIIFGPTLLQPKQDMLNMVKDMSDQCRIVESIIQHCDWFFSSWDEDVNVPADSQKDSTTIPITGMDQQLLEKAEHMVFEEQASINKRLWRPNVARKTNSKDRCTSSSGAVELINERNIDEEILIRSGATGDRKKAIMTDVKNAKTRAKSVPPRPVSTLQVHPGKPVEKMTETAPAKRKNSSPVNIQRRESAVPGGKSASKHQFQRSSSEANDTTYHVSSNVKTRQPGALSSSRNITAEQRESGRQRKSISSHALFNVKLPHSHKPTSTLTQRGSEEKLGSPHSNRSSHISSSRGTIASDFGDSRQKKGGQHHVNRTDGPSRPTQSKSSPTVTKKPGVVSRREEKLEIKTADSSQHEITDAVKETEQEKREEKNSEYPSAHRIDTECKDEVMNSHVTEEPCGVLWQAGSRKVWNATEKTWEDLPKARDQREHQSTPKRSSAKTTVEGSACISSDLSNSSVGFKHTENNATEGCWNTETVVENVFMDKMNLNEQVKGKDKREQIPGVAEPSTEKPVLNEDKENRIDVVLSDGEIISKQSPVHRQHVKPSEHDASDGRDSVTKMTRNCTGNSPVSIVEPQNSLSTPGHILLHHNLSDSQRNVEMGDSQAHSCVEPLVILYDNDSQESEKASSPQKDSLKDVLDFTSSDYQLEPYQLLVDDPHRSLQRTSSEPSIRVSSPILPQFSDKSFPKKGTKPPKQKRSNSTSTRSRSNQSATDRLTNANTRPIYVGCYGLSPNESSRSLTYESSV